jgi:hypothetical protein
MTDNSAPFSSTRWYVVAAWINITLALLAVLASLLADIHPLLRVIGLMSSLVLGAIGIAALRNRRG